MLNDYFDNISPTLWPSVAARDAVYGYQEGTVFCHQPLGSYQPEVWDPSTGASCTVPADQVYSAANSEGVRCSLQDYLVAILGTRPQDGFANRMLDNVGLQYGLTALARGSISPEQFVDLNQKIGGWDIDANRQQQRSEADPTALERMYRSGQIVYGTQLEKAAIIDARIGANNDVHSNLQQQITRARIVRANGHHRNHVSWYEPVVAAIGLPTPETMSLTFVKMDEWLSKVEADRSDDPIEIKLARNRPIDVTDACVASGVRVPDESCIAARLYYGDPRIVAGMPLTRDLLKCRLKPLERSDYNVEFTADQWSRLQEAFPTGVCDWSRPGVGQRPNIPWLTYEDGPGGRPLGPPPRSGPFGGPGS